MTTQLAVSAKEARTLGPRFEYWVERQAEKRFARCGDGSWLSYSEAERRSSEIAAGLQALGVSKGDRVALISATRIEMVLALIALSRMGAVAVPLNTYLKGEFLRFQVKDSLAATVIADAAGFAALAAISSDLPDLRTVVLLDEEEAHTGAITLQATFAVHAFGTMIRAAADYVPPQVVATDPATILYTSGTTGMPKGCVCSQGFLMIYSLSMIEEGWLEHDDVVFSVFPLFHSAGLCGALVGTIQAGASLFLERSFSASRFTLRAAESGATVALGVGAMGMAVLASGASEFDRAHRLRLCSFPPMPPASQEAFEARFGCDIVCAGYGQTEAAPIAFLGAAEAKKARAAVGRPSPRFDVKLVDDDDQPVPTGSVGEVVCRPREPEVMFQGYWNRPDATLAVQRNLWHHLGDLARFDADGLLYFVDRKKDAMRRRGENVSSVELEHAILKHPKIAAVATHAVASDLGEDDIKACVVLNEGAAVETAELFEFFRLNLPYYAVPRYVEFMAALPLNASGRVMKPLLRERGIGAALDFEALGLSIPRDQRRA